MLRSKKGIGLLASGSGCRGSGDCDCGAGNSKRVRGGVDGGGIGGVARKLFVCALLLLAMEVIILVAVVVMVKMVALMVNGDDGDNAVGYDLDSEFTRQLRKYHTKSYMHVS
jgi:hypothetical protein